MLDYGLIYILAISVVGAVNIQPVPRFSNNFLHKVDDFNNIVEPEGANFPQSNVDSEMTENKRSDNVEENKPNIICKEEINNSPPEEKNKLDNVKTQLHELGKLFINNIFDNFNTGKRNQRQEDVQEDNHIDFASIKSEEAEKAENLSAIMKNKTQEIENAPPQELNDDCDPDKDLKPTSKEYLTHFGRSSSPKLTMQFYKYRPRTVESQFEDDDPEKKKFVTINLFPENIPQRPENYPPEPPAKIDYVALISNEDQLVEVPAIKFTVITNEDYDENLDIRPREAHYEPFASFRYKRQPNVQVKKINYKDLSTVPILFVNTLPTGEGTKIIRKRSSLSSEKYLPLANFLFKNVKMSLKRPDKSKDSTNSHGILLYPNPSKSLIDQTNIGKDKMTEDELISKINDPSSNPREEAIFQEKSMRELVDPLLKNLHFQDFLKDTNKLVQKAFKNDDKIDANRKYDFQKQENPLLTSKYLLGKFPSVNALIKNEQKNSKAENMEVFGESSTSKAIGYEENKKKNAASNKIGAKSTILKKEANIDDKNEMPLVAENKERQLEQIIQIANQLEPKNLIQPQNENVNQIEAKNLIQSQNENLNQMEPKNFIQSQNENVNQMEPKSFFQSQNENVNQMEPKSFFQSQNEITGEQLKPNNLIQNSNSQLDETIAKNVILQNRIKSEIEEAQYLLPKTDANLNNLLSNIPTKQEKNAPAVVRNVADENLVATQAQEIAPAELEKHSVESENAVVPQNAELSPIQVDNQIVNAASLIKDTSGINNIEKKLEGEEKENLGTTEKCLETKPTTMVMPTVPAEINAMAENHNNKTSPETCNNASSSSSANLGQTNETGSSNKSGNGTEIVYDDNSDDYDLGSILDISNGSTSESPGTSENSTVNSLKSIPTIGGNSSSGTPVTATPVFETDTPKIQAASTEVTTVRNARLAPTSPSSKSAIVNKLKNLEKDLKLVFEVQNILSAGTQKGNEKTNRRKRALLNSELPTHCKNKRNCHKHHKVEEAENDSVNNGSFDHQSAFINGLGNILQWKRKNSGESNDCRPKKRFIFKPKKKNKHQINWLRRVAGGPDRPRHFLGQASQNYH